jgi:sulfite exporter TauE/SafE
VNWLAIFGAGLLAGATTCAVAQGGLLVGLISRQKKAAIAAGIVPSGQPSSVADDLFPVAGFLAGKLVVLVAAGVLLGSIGSLLAPDTRIGGGAMLVAATVMVVFGLSTLGVPGFRAIVLAPPARWTRVVRKSTRSQSAFAPFLLGLATLLLPCGVTISMMLLATTSGSAAAGGMVMAVFVLGTAPMFAAYGFVTQRYLSKASRGMSLALGSVVVVMGLFTLNAGLVVLASPITAQSIVASVGRSAVPETTVPAPGLTNGVQVLRINATSNGYAPNRLAAIAGVPTRIVIHTDNTRSCIVYTVLPTLGKQVTLPQSGNTSLDLGTLAAGEIPINCSMGMFVGTIVVS